jgi:6-phosphogluconolactonase
VAAHPVVIGIESAAMGVQPGKLRLRVFPDSVELARAGAKQFVELAQSAIDNRGRFDVALSGGSTPRAMYALLAREGEFRDAIAWPRVHLFWGDERHVPQDHPDSNYRMVRESLIDHVVIPDENVHPMPVHLADASAVASAYQSELAGCFGGRMPEFDLVLLGLGADAHTASLFPGTPAVGETGRWVYANWVEKLAAHRLTLTAPVLNTGRTKLFLVAGADKADAVYDVLRGARNVAQKPAQLIEPHGGVVTWLVDDAAAGRLAR